MLIELGDVDHRHGIELGDVDHRHGRRPIGGGLLHHSCSRSFFVPAAIRVLCFLFKCTFTILTVGNQDLSIENTFTLISDSHSKFTVIVITINILFDPLSAVLQSVDSRYGPQHFQDCNVSMLFW